MANPPANRGQDELANVGRGRASQPKNPPPRPPDACSRRYRETELVINRELEQMPDDLRPQHIIDDGSYDDAA
jgi:hypothetical protein